MAKSTIVDSINRFDEKDYSTTASLITFGKQVAQFANRRLSALEKAGLSNRATTGGVKHIDVRDVTDKASALQAISKARSLIANPLSTPGTVRKMIKESQEEYGMSGARMKWVAVWEPVYDKKTGEPTGTMKLVPKAVPWGTEREAMSWADASKKIKSFWTWYHDEMEQWVSSDEAQSMVEDTQYDTRRARKFVRNIATHRKQPEQQYGDQISQITRESDWLK